jgi:hypothetical protein
VTGPQVRVHALSGDVTVDVPGQEPDTATETTQPIRPLTPARLRMLTALRSPSMRLAAGLVMLVALVLLLRGHDDNTATTRPVVTATPTVMVDTTSTEAATPSTTTPTPDPAAIAPRPLTEDQLDQLPLAVVGQSLPHAPADPAPASDPGPEVLHPTATTAVYDAPGGQPFARLPVRQVFTPTWVPVVQRQPGWARVLLPTRPLDGGIAPTGWLYLDQTVVLSQSAHRVDIDHTTGSATVLARLSRVTTDSGPPDPTSAPATRPRTFMAITPATIDGGWLARIWQPLLINSDRICTGMLGTLVMPALSQVSPLGQSDGQGCMPTPDGLRVPLSSVTAGTVVLQR